MAVRTILVAASGGSASDGAVETACRLAARLGAHLEGFHVKTDTAQIVLMASEGYNTPFAAEWVERMMADMDTLAEKVGASFAAAAARHNLKSQVAWRVESGYGPVEVARRARFFDLVVLGRSERVVERPATDTIEETLARSGRPVLLAPAKPPDAIGSAVAIGWNGSSQAVHAIAGALTLLEKADTVTVITVGEDDENAGALLEYLGFHGVKAAHRAVLPVEHVGAGEQLLSEAREAGADLLLMGAYGHRPWRETLFGGATRQVVGRSLLPILLAH